MSPESPSGKDCPCPHSRAESLLGSSITHNGQPVAEVIAVRRATTDPNDPSLNAICRLNGRDEFVAIPVIPSGKDGADPYVPMQCCLSRLLNCEDPPQAP